MRLTEFLSPEMFKVPLAGTTKGEVIRELVELACRDAPAEQIEAVVRSVLERERLMSSGIGQGIALPHGYSTGLTAFAAAFGIPTRPIDFDAIDGLPVTLVFLVLSDDEHTTTKLKALARISRHLHREAFRTALAASTTAAEAMGVIADEESRHRI
jgi:mannitol/fructose-specific phosphotransferase system IIA component (Ntr-type)